MIAKILIRGLITTLIIQVCMRKLSEDVMNERKRHCWTVSADDEK